MGQWTNRVDLGEPSHEPADLMAGALSSAALDAGITLAELASADSIRVVRTVSWRYADPGRLVSAKLGAGSSIDSAISSGGGNDPQSLVNDACRDITRGESDLVLICGAESARSRAMLRRGGERPSWTPLGDKVRARTIGQPMELCHPAELDLSVVLPTQVYALFEQALRVSTGVTIEQHSERIAELWQRLSSVAATNPHAWSQKSLSADTIRTPTRANRLVSWPYTKLMCANNQVDQGAGLIVCSEDRARSLGIGRDRWVYPLAGVDVHEPLFVTERAELSRSQALADAGRRLFDIAAVTPDDLAFVDVYSCFPSAVQIGVQELGLDPDRSVSVTGGLSFAGGPWNNYVSHSLATMVNALRTAPGSVGLVTANGGYLTRHALGLYSTEPGGEGFRYDGRTRAPRPSDRCEVLAPTAGDAVIETWTVDHGRDGLASRAIALCRRPDQSRVLCVSDDPQVAQELASGSEQAGRLVSVDVDGRLALQPRTSRLPSAAPIPSAR